MKSDPLIAVSEATPSIACSSDCPTTASSASSSSGSSSSSDQLQSLQQQYHRGYPGSNNNQRQHNLIYSPQQSQHERRRNGHSAQQPALTRKALFALNPVYETPPIIIGEYNNNNHISNHNSNSNSSAIINNRKAFMRQTNNMPSAEPAKQQTANSSEGVLKNGNLGVSTTINGVDTHSPCVSPAIPVIIASGEAEPTKKLSSEDNAGEPGSLDNENEESKEENKETMVDGSGSPAKQKPARPSTLMPSAPCFTPRKQGRHFSSQSSNTTAAAGSMNGSYNEASSAYAGDMPPNGEAYYDGAGSGGGYNEQFCAGAPPLPSFVFCPQQFGAISAVNGHDQHAVYVHVNPGETLSVRVGNELQHIPGPATVRMVSQTPGPQGPLPLHVPPGHVVQQIVDENGALKHLILSPQHPHPPGSIDQNASSSPNVNFIPILPSSGSPVPVGNAGHLTSMMTYVPMNLPSESVPQMSSSPTTAAMQQNSMYANIPNRRSPAGPPQRHVRHAEMPCDDSDYPEYDAHQQQRYCDRQRKRFIPRPRPSGRGGGGTSFRGRDENQFRRNASPRMTTTSNDNEKDVDSIDNEEKAKLIELLSKLQPPRVVEFGSRDALFQWQRIDCSEASCGPFPEIEASDFDYEVFLSEGAPEGKYRVIFRGGETEFRCAELKPATEYYVKIRALIEPWRGNLTDPVKFRTKSCRPDKPSTVRVCNRTKTSITIKWNAAHENGSRVTNYQLECDQTQNATDDSGFEEVYRGLDKQFRMAKLEAGFTYRFRLAASNDCGKSDFGDIVTVSTAGNPPPAPNPPQLLEAEPYSLHLAWQKRPGDVDFVLQMDDPQLEYGFITVCNGSELSCICSELKHSQTYHFRLRVVNEDGESNWSETVSYRTRPAKPSAPGKPYPKGRIHATSVKLAWDAPADSGGSDIQNYSLECSSPDNADDWAVLYAGMDTEYNAIGLSPGRTYQFRVRCSSEGGQSPYSGHLAVTTLAVPPGQCQPPTLHSKPKSNSLHLRWVPPEQNGGADVTQFEVHMTQADGTQQTLSPGLRCDCAVAGLLPGRTYVFRVRAQNKAGHGTWSEPLEVTTAPGPPDPPNQLRCVARTPHIVLVSWTEPTNNGAPIIEYRVQQASKRRQPSMHALLTDRAVLEKLPRTTEEVSETAENTSETRAAKDVDRRDDAVECQKSDHTDIKVSPPSSTPSSAGSSPQHRPRSHSGASSTISALSDVCGALTSDGSFSTAEFLQVFAGLSNECEIRNLKPATEYAFRIQAVNSTGLSKFSHAYVCCTPPSVPNVVSTLQAETISTTQIAVDWEEPDCNGSAILGYRLEVSVIRDGTCVVLYCLDLNQDELHSELSNLDPDTLYKLRVLAFNDLGNGPWSSGMKVATFSPPPKSPHLECIGVNHNALKLRWSSSSSTTEELISYCLEMENRNGRFSPVYEGPSHVFKVTKLNECTTYQFRIRATSTTGGSGTWSETTYFTTSRTPPPALKYPPKISFVGQGIWLIEWQPVKTVLPLGERLTYSLQVNSSKQPNEEYKTVYVGPSTSYQLTSEADTSYRVRVCPIRVSACDNAEIETPGPHSLIASFPVAMKSADGSGSNSLISVSGSTVLSDAEPLEPLTLREMVRAIVSGERELTERQFAALVLLGFSAIALLIAFLVQHFVAS